MPGSIAPGSAFFMIGTWRADRRARSVEAKIAVNSQKKQMRDAGDADAAVEKLAVEAEPLLVGEARRQARSPAPSQTGQKRARHAEEDLEAADIFHLHRRPY